jgi:hypothetical protein
MKSLLPPAVEDKDIVNFLPNGMTVRETLPSSDGARKRHSSVPMRFALLMRHEGDEPGRGIFFESPVRHLKIRDPVPPEGAKIAAQLAPA